jgi:hypothetical protein
VLHAMSTDNSTSVTGNVGATSRRFALPLDRFWATP